ncbi:hypothetical protein BD413DRAFT_481709 [Trametes elegans]|nr:hypothetical protein BD413DRAFT_481709 [Trametes elegans]
MSSHAQPSSPFSRLSRLAFPFKSNPSSPLSAEPQSEDWYIPYRGPIEPPKNDRNTDSWGHLVSGWIMENQDGRPERPRALSNASRKTADEHKRKSSRIQPSYVNLDQAGGVGDTPVPARPRRSQEVPQHHRASLASLLSFGSKKAHKLQHSSSAGELRKEPVPPVPQDPAYASGSQQTFPRHPYAYATPAPSAPPVSSPVVTTAPQKSYSASRFSVRLLDPLAERPTAPAYLLPSRRPSRLSIKASMSTPNLRQATGTAAVLPKGKQRWLSAETWCDALILPRPRFAMRVIDGEEGAGSGRIVSPPESPLWPPGVEPPLDAAGAKTLKKAQSAIQLSSRPPAPSPPRPPPVREVPVRVEPVREQPEPGPSRVTVMEAERGGGPSTHLAPRPKSFALDDLALPSPVPSLSKVLEDGRMLEEERKIWQRQASSSFGAKRARSVSRARAKSAGARTPSHGHSREGSALDALAEATLLGSQRRRPTIHVRVRPPRSDGHATTSAYGTGTMTGTGTGTGTGIATFTSASHGGTRSRTTGHGHSNSLGSVSQQQRSDESFMWAPGHGRNHSLGRTALRMVRTTATTAAGLCGVAGGHDVDDYRDKGKAPMSEKAAAMEDALHRESTKIMHLRDQLPAREQRPREASGNIVMISPSTDAGVRSGQQQLGVGPSGMQGTSPTPSALSGSGEGVGIAISSPLSQQEAFDEEPIRIAHPYAQGSYQYYERPHGKTPALPAIKAVHVDDPAGYSPTATTSEDGTTRHRQPIVVHPYSPYTQVAHPYAAITGNDPASNTGARPRPGKHLAVRPPAPSSMFAELSPGHIREILPDEIQYSPFIPTPPVQLPEGAQQPNPAGHPYGPPTKRTSEWGFADALSHTMQRPLSTDSGLGTSESHEIPPLPNAPDRIQFSHVLDDSDDVVVISPDQGLDAEEMNILTPRSKPGMDNSDRHRHRPGLRREVTQASSNHTLASSPMENVNPPLFRKDVSPGQRSFHSSGSSPGVVSQQSSPPLSPRPINSTDDLERFRDLFYRPPESRTPSSESSRPPVSRRPSETVPIELHTRSTRTLSGLTSLARQLNENMEEMEATNAEDEYENVWGARHGRESQRPEFGPEPTQALSQSPPGLVYEREGTQSPLRLPIDASLVLSQPSDNVPEDVESSRASSMLELPLEDEPERMRIGEIEAVTTPPPFATPKRFSTHLSAVGFPDGEISPISERNRRVDSQQSSLGVPLSSRSDAARSSFMTNTSGMSGLSDFPVPPTQITDSHLSILHAYYGEGAHDYRESRSDVSRPGLVREASQATFGPQQMGEAL